MSPITNPATSRRWMNVVRFSSADHTMSSGSGAWDTCGRDIAGYRGEILAEIAPISRPGSRLQRDVLLVPLGWRVLNDALAQLRDRVGLRH